MKASIASSAQCRSSTTSTVGAEAARPSRNCRQAAKFSSREASSASRPTSGRRRDRSRSRSGPSGRTVSRRASARATPSLSRMPAESRTISRERPEGDAAAEGQAAALAPDDELGDGRRGGGRTRRAVCSCRCRARRREGRSGDVRRRPSRRAGPGARRAPPPCRRTRSETAQLGAGACQRRGRDPGAQRLALAFHGDRVAGVEGEDLLGGGMRGLADGDGHRRGGALQAGRHVDGVAGEEALAARRGRRRGARGPRRC